MTDSQDRRVLTQLQAAVEDGRSVALATIVSTRRSVPRHAGTKMLVFPDGSSVGTIGGGEMESRVLAESLGSLATGRPKLLDYALVEPARGDPGLCGGEVQIYVEPYMPAHTVVVVGGGHVGRTLVDLANWLGYRTVVVDDRPDRLTPEEMPNADERVVGPMSEALGRVSITEDTSVAVVTRNVELDVAVIPALLETPARYIGVMGSERRWKEVRSRLSEAGLGDAAIDRLHAPIGLDIHAETLEEIAVSIMSQIIQERGVGAD